MPIYKNEQKDNETKEKPVKLKPRNINKSTKSIFEHKKKKTIGTDHQIE